MISQADVELLMWVEPLLERVRKPKLQRQRRRETDLGSDSKSGITAKYNPGLSHRDRTVGQ